MINIKGLIKQKGWSIRAVATAMGITEVTLHQNLDGKVVKGQKMEPNPSVTTLRRIADVIGCKVGDFFKDELSKEPTEDFVTDGTLKCPYCGREIKLSAVGDRQEYDGLPI